MESQLYTRAFYEYHQDTSLQSAREIVPIVLELIQPHSVIDVGCGTGTWLSVFKQAGISDCLGIDGEYVDPSLRLITPAEFVSHDLKQPLKLGRTFDLVVSLETAEHLPEDCADRFVASLTSLGAVILFSAAIPFQGGDGHINEQWADYWVERFRQRGYQAIDCLRERLWNNDQVQPWYAQNLLVFVQQDSLPNYPKLLEAARLHRPGMLSLVHPHTYTRVVTWLYSKLQDALNQPQRSPEPSSPIAESGFDPNNPQINPRDLFQLYLNQDYDQLSERFLRVLEHFENKTYFSLSPVAQYFINAFVKHFLHLFVQPDYILSDRHVTRFLQLNLTISNLVAISSFRTTDAYLEILRDQPNNFAKFLTLYSARNTVKLDRDLIFASNPQLACLWYSCVIEIYRTGLVNPVVQQNLREHLTYNHEQLTTFYRVDDLSFGATYIDGEQDRIFKRRINASIQSSPFCTNAVIHNTPNPKKIAVISALWFSRHSVYRILYEFVDALKDDYELTLVHLGAISSHNDIDVGCFKHVRYAYIKDGTLNIDSLRENDFALAYYPDIGMSLESIFLSNLRIAPIQVCGLGHSVSTHGAEIDYFISGADVELTHGAEQCYSERLVLLPGAGAIHSHPDYQLQHRQKSRPEFIINCPWFAQKVNYSLICHLQEIVRQAKKPLLFRFFSGAALLRKNDFLPFVRDLTGLLGSNHVEVVPAKPYAEYMGMMEEGDICLDSYHFGGCNTIADGLFLRKPTITFEGSRWYSRIGSQMLRQVGLGELVAKTPEEYIELTLQLIHNDSYREQICTMLQSVDLDHTIFSTEGKMYFKQAIDYLLQNHDQLQTSTSRTPIYIGTTNHNTR